MLVVCLVAAVLIVQRLSVELVQLQIRERTPVSASLATLAGDFAVPEAFLKQQLRLPPGTPGSATLEDIARLTGRPAADVRRDAIAAAFAWQFRDVKGAGAIGLRAPPADSR